MGCIASSSSHDTSSWKGISHEPKLHSPPNPREGQGLQGTLSHAEWRCLREVLGVRASEPL